MDENPNPYTAAARTNPNQPGSAQRSSWDGPVPLETVFQLKIVFPSLEVLAADGQLTPATGWDRAELLTGRVALLGLFEPEDHAELLALLSTGGEATLRVRDRYGNIVHAELNCVCSGEASQLVVRTTSVVSRTPGREPFSGALMFSPQSRPDGTLLRVVHHVMTSNVEMFSRNGAWRMLQEWVRFVRLIESGAGLDSEVLVSPLASMTVLGSYDNDRLGSRLHALCRDFARDGSSIEVATGEATGRWPDVFRVASDAARLAVDAESRYVFADMFDVMKYQRLEQIRTLFADGVPPEMAPLLRPSLDTRNDKVDWVDFGCQLHHPELGLVRSVEIHTALVGTPQMREMRHWGINSAADVARRLQTRPQPPTVCVRFEAEFLSDEGDVDLLCHRARALPPRAIGLDLVLQPRTVGLAKHRETLLRLRRDGVRLFLSGYGAGPCDLSPLAMGVLDVLVLNSTIAETLAVSAVTQRLCDLLVSVAAGLGIAVAAENVSTDSEAVAYARHGVYLQRGPMLADWVLPEELLAALP